MTQRGVLLQDLTVRLGQFTLNNLGLSVSATERLVILGPNGAGKSVTLETIAGFHRPRAGRIVIHGRDVTPLPPERRNVAFVLQNFALFPHLTVAGNIGLGLRRAPHGRRREKLAELLDRLGIAHLAGRMPDGLSPGEKQRTALARALAADPDVFLFDEPFSALDAGTHERLRQELLAFLAQARIPAIFVTHDRGDALVLGTSLAVMRAGSLLQTGPVRDVFRAPASRFVADLLGVENIFAARVSEAEGGCTTVVANGTTLHAASATPASAGTDLLVAIRAEDIDLLSPGCDRPPGNRLQVRIRRVMDEGVLTRLDVDCGFALQIRALSRTVRAMGLGPGGEVAIAIAPDAIHLLPPGSVPLPLWEGKATSQ